MRAFAVELGQNNIRVNSVLPTQVSTTMLMNDQTFRLFRPDLWIPAPRFRPDLANDAHTADSLGGCRRYQQRGAVFSF